MIPTSYHRVLTQRPRTSVTLGLLSAVKLLVYVTMITNLAVTPLFVSEVSVAYIHVAVYRYCTCFLAVQYSFPCNVLTLKYVNYYVHATCSLSIIAL